MLQLRPTCEHCKKILSPNSEEAMICSYECTFCSDCVSEILQNVCPNCGGGFQKRPIRPIQELKKNLASQEKIYKPIQFDTYLPLQKRNKNIPPSKR